MKKFISWLIDVFAPNMQKIVKNPWIAGLSSTMQKIIPFILTGSMVFIYNIFRSYFPSLPDLGIISNFTFGLLGLLVAFMVANQLMEKLQHQRYTLIAGLTSISVFLMFIKPVFDDGMMVVDFGRFGPSGIFVGMVAGYFVSIIFYHYGKLNLLSESNIPIMVVEWINNILPIIIAISITAILAFRVDMDIFDLIVQAFSPIQSFGQTLPGLILIVFLMAFFYSLGISAWIWNAVTTPIFMQGIMENIEAVNQGLEVTNIVTSETVFTAALITMGGVGATLGLNLLMLISKSKELRTVGRLFIFPSFFNINEPIMFSTVVMNPLLMLPLWINAITGPTVVWLAMSSGFLNIPSQMIQVGQIPAPFSSVMITQDLKAVIVYFILLGMYLITWYPFFKAYEKKRLQQEGSGELNKIN
ncbi:PTS transporter subunit EIIC [Salipaludibacillus sp. LMS25]|jgi:PTS system cellobiose-specific IIC component|uniref:PTS sugar transporter subunit IIC n=1 Tax=Salipaludibacillus sp. LMS25 TaxID=2924031 RepID=UPI0020D06A58|nr:PTS transporter subunit EIIC [Salipaludibacillus sp. LMS25]UTR13729.1 PTS transporter subunit EIIC [Salipaludibacillus sp. LMS25]